MSNLDMAIFRAKTLRFQAEAMRFRLAAEMEMMRSMTVCASAAGYRLPSKPAPAKCPACGSHEFRTHNLVRVCSYCRCAA